MIKFPQPQPALNAASAVDFSFLSALTKIVPHGQRLSVK